MGWGGGKKTGKRTGERVSLTGKHKLMGSSHSFMQYFVIGVVRRDLSAGNQLTREIDILKTRNPQSL